MYNDKIRWPLVTNRIQRGKMGTFGMVRNGGTRAHDGWDLYANLGTACYAVGDGVVESVHYSASYGNIIDISLNERFRGMPIYARYAHLSMSLANLYKGIQIKKGQPIGFTGNTGNAANLKPIDRHLHFEFLKFAQGLHLGKNGLLDRFDPSEIYGVTPLGQTVYDPCINTWEPSDGRTMPQR